MQIVKKIATFGTVGALVFTLSACGGNDDSIDQNDRKESALGLDLGISMPQKTSENWTEAETYFNLFCEKRNLKCSVLFANNGVSEQQQQIDTMLDNGVKVLVVGAVDSSSLGAQLQKASAAGVPVIAYDRLLMDTSDINYYVAYDNFNVGEKQGTALLKGLAAKKPGGPWNIEVFAGSSDDANSAKFFAGAMSVLQPQIEAGNLRIVSGQSTQEEVGTDGWKPENAASRMDALLARYYPNEGPDGVLSPNDTLGRAIITSCEKAGKELPVVTGQDSEVESLKWIMQGKQYSTISKPTKPMVDAVGSLALKLLQGAENLKDINRIPVDDKQYDNGKKVVPAFLLPAVVATKENAVGVYNDEPTKLDAVNSVK